MGRDKGYAKRRECTRGKLKVGLKYTVKGEGTSEEEDGEREGMVMKGQ